MRVASTTDAKGRIAAVNDSEVTALIINADDFGISRGVNTGIIEAAESGVVTSASVMVNMPGFADALDRAVSYPALSLGLHLNFTVGRPLTDVPSLTRRATGEFYALGELVTRASLGLVDTAEVEEECLAQVDLMTEAGFPPTHLDSHRHIHAHPALSATIVRAAASRGVTSVRIPREPLLTNLGNWRATLKKTGLAACTRLSSRAHPPDRHFFGVSLQGGRSFASRLFSLVTQLPAGTSELMTHPGYADSSLAEHDSYTLDRVTELRALCSREFRDVLTRSGVTLTSFTDCNSRRAERGELSQ
jgi:predicted glycoside hydrolase/deacetylase ChbG (UPF0249 family)